jgi:predicted metal-dependent hydrolase
MMMMLIETLLLLHVQKNLLPLMVIQRQVRMSLPKIMNKKIISMSSDKREEPVRQKILAQLHKQRAQRD